MNIGPNDFLAIIAPILHEELDSQEFPWVSSRWVNYTPWRGLHLDIDGSKGKHSFDFISQDEMDRWDSKKLKELMVAVVEKVRKLGET
jgi:hypothetical protein